MKYKISLIIAITVIFIFCPGNLKHLHAQIEVTPEYEVKAVFLFNFAQFVKWPDSVFAKNNSPLIIGILGKDPFGNYLDQTVKGEKIKGHPLLVKRYQDENEIGPCQILFINPPSEDQLKQILDLLKGRNILTVGDSPSFAQAGGIIRFLTVNDKIRFQINLTAAREAELNISSKLLRVAEVINND